MTRLLIVVLLAATVLMSGCTLTESTSQSNRRLAIITDLNVRMIGDDFQAIWLYDRVSRLTQFHPRVGP